MDPQHCGYLLMPDRTHVLRSKQQCMQPALGSLAVWQCSPCCLPTCVQVDEALVCMGPGGGTWEQLHHSCDPSLRGELPPASTARDAIADLPENVIPGECGCDSATSPVCALPSHVWNRGMSACSRWASRN